MKNYDVHCNKFIGNGIIYTLFFCSKQLKLKIAEKNPKNKEPESLEKITQT